ncbi:MAG: hypothetical protein M1833_003300 [Piccolia ochrophora]|nr:MAG: hypothetical protein M1833_003300 [Piccolia ochrophora]
MDRTRVLSLSGLVLCCSLLSLTYKTSFAFDHPTSSAALSLLIGGLTVLGVNHYIPNFLGPPAAPGGFPDLSVELTRPRSLSQAAYNELYVGNGCGNARPFRLLFISTVIAILVRVELFRRVVGTVQCALPGIESLLPLVVALYDWWTVRRKGSKPTERSWATFPNNLSVVIHSEYRYLFTACLISLGSILAATYSFQPTSTYICPKASGVSLSIYQYLGVLNDVALLFLINALVDEGSNHALAGSKQRPAALGWLFVVSGLFLGTSVIVALVAMPEHRRGMVTLDVPYVKSVIILSFLFISAVAFAFRSFSTDRPLAVAMVVTITCTVVSQIASAWEVHNSFPPVPIAAFVFSSVFLYVGLIHFLLAQPPPDCPHAASTTNTVLLLRRIPPWIYVSVVMLWLLQLTFVSVHSSIIGGHPIQHLMQSAAKQHGRWTKQAHKSQTLAEAVTEYQRRYGRSPPPGFDEWYAFATARSSILIDDFDGIYEDLLPFWSLSPSDLRERTWEMTSNPFNFISGVRIRNGEVELGPNTIPTHRWMVTGVAEIVKPFAQLLPDMVMAFNLNDECRVSVPWKEAARMRKVAQSTENAEKAKKTQWSSSRGHEWKELTKETISFTRFKENALANTFYSYGAPLCPPSSKSRQDRIWDTGVLCVGCAQPHSLGQFLQDWTLAADICHQPDLANLHGLFLSPAAFRGTHDLMPVFSQSKVHGFSDIRYPSAWNYVDKVKYDPDDAHPDVPFNKKNNALFWRGATSEGVSVDGTWKGMGRQRLLHLASNRIADYIPILLPADRKGYRHFYENVPADDLKPYLSLDFGVVDKIDRCQGQDCQDQQREFIFKEKSDFQAHWRYKYLFDLDGAGFSGRFLPFLKSHSLPFKTALFREWYDTRLTPWLHFVPQDLRLHGVHSTLAFFAGLQGRLGGRDVSMKAHDKEGEFIAEQGREWAEKVLRKEDMEIYFFRLLLEWGRLTDDQRDDLGFTI